MVVVRRTCCSIKFRKLKNLKISVDCNVLEFNNCNFVSVFHNSYTANMFIFIIKTNYYFFKICYLAYFLYIIG